MIIKMNLRNIIFGVGIGYFYFLSFEGFIGFIIKFEKF